MALTVSHVVAEYLNVNCPSDIFWTGLARYLTSFSILNHRISVSLRQANMFYDGSLQDGISTAVGQQKLVLCFVTSLSSMSSRIVQRHISNVPQQMRTKPVKHGRMNTYKTPR